MKLLSHSGVTAEAREETPEDTVGGVVGVVREAPEEQRMVMSGDSGSSRRLLVSRSSWISASRRKSSRDVFDCLEPDFSSSKASIS